MVRSPSAAPIKAAPADDDEEPPLDPAVERVRQRLKRLIVISSTTLLVGVVAVLVAVVYRIGPERGKSAIAPAASETVIAAAVPAGAHVLSSALDGTTMALTVDIGGTSHIILIDLAAGSIIRRYSLETQH